MKVHQLRIYQQLNVQDDSLQEYSHLDISKMNK